MDNGSTAGLAKTTRRSQADRSATTRAKVIAAAADVLRAQGYSGATCSDPGRHRHEPGRHPAPIPFQGETLGRGRRRVLYSSDQDLPGRHPPRQDAAGIDGSVQIISNAVTRGLTVEYIRNPDKAAIEHAARIWKEQMLTLLFGD